MMQLWAYQNMLIFPLLFLFVVYCSQKQFVYLATFVVWVTLADTVWAIGGGHGIHLGYTMSLGVGATILPMLGMRWKA